MLVFLDNEATRACCCWVLPFVVVKVSVWVFLVGEVAGVRMPKLTKLGSGLLPLSTVWPVVVVLLCCCCCCTMSIEEPPLATLVASLSILLAVALAAIRLLTDLAVGVLLVLMDTKPSVLRIKLLLLLLPVAVF